MATSPRKFCSRHDPDGDHPAMPSPIPQYDRRPTDHHPVYLFLTGLCMGSADVVPGVSGGTMAFIMGIYHELLSAIRSVNVELLRQLVRGQWRAAMTDLPWGFLIPWGTGVVTALLSLAGLLNYLLHHHESLIYAFFFGLVAASIATMATSHVWDFGNTLACLLGSGFAFWLVGLVPLEPGHSAWIMFGSGAIAICAMILPGVSGAFLLLVLGQYAHCVEAISNCLHAIRHGEMDVLIHNALGTVLPFGFGAALGLAAFARILGWLLRYYGHITIAVLIGFMVGSLRRLWPFKRYLEYGENRHGERIPISWQNIWPTSDHAWAVALGLSVIGFILILAIHRLARTLRASRS